MSETTRTTTTHRPNLDDLARRETITAGIQAHALVSTGLHMSRHALPAVYSVEVPTTFGDTDRVRIHVAPRHLNTWVDSLNGATAGAEDDETDGLLPDTGLRVTVYTTHLTLAVVPA